MQFRGIIRILIWPAVVSSAVALLVFWMADPLNLTAPSDQKLIAIFHEHRAAFEELRQMATADLQKESYFSLYVLDDKLGKARK
jgi:hypothetical protein